MRARRVLAACQTALAAPTRRVLILNSCHKEFQWTDDQVSAAQEVLSTALENLELYVEYMDTKRVFNEP